MKHLFKYIFAITGILIISCNDGIDDITQVDPGVDETAPQITIVYPTEGTEIKVFEDITSIEIELKVTDDIEISNVSVHVDGTEIASYSEFKDYRIFIEEITFGGLADGDHKLTVNATDIEGKSSTSEVNFKKSPPYSPLFAGEVFYMPFDGDYMDLISFQKAIEVGSPGFSDDPYVGLNSLMGATDSYLTFPMDGLTTTEFSAAFWYKVDATPDRAGILVVGDDESDRFQGFRLFREGNADEQRIKLNVGTGAGESWNDGDVIDVTAGDWVHIAISISETQSKIYFNGIEMRSSDLSAPVDWTGCEVMTIASGGETFSYWNHNSDLSNMDELRLFNKALTATDIQIMINSLSPYNAKFGEKFYMPFDGDYIDLAGSIAATSVGSPGFAGESQSGTGDAFRSATDSYITYPTDRFVTSNEFSAAFWYKVNPDPDRAGILVVGSDVAEDRTKGFRLFREGSATEQRIKLNVGTGSGESWNDGDVIDATAGEWVHIAFTISGDKNTIYFNGMEVRSSDMSGSLDWTDVGDFTIGSGGTTFDYWGHGYDLSALDELYMFDKALSAEEVMDMYGGGYEPADGETLYMPFNGNYSDMVSGSNASETGTPGYAGESKVGNDAFAGATDSYLTFPIDGLFGNEFSGAFWYKVNADPDRAGILTVGPPMNGTDNDLSAGFRLFREGSASEQRIKLHVGTDGGDVWNDGDVIDPSVGDWIHIAFTVSADETKIYFDGVPVTNTGNMSGKTVSWDNCTIVSIGSGAPNFIGWSHLSDLSYIDELKLFNKALSQQEIQDLMN